MVKWLVDSLLFFRGVPATRWEFTAGKWEYKELEQLFVANAVAGAKSPRGKIPSIPYVSCLSNDEG